HHYKAKTGRSIRLDWRTPGGTSEIARFLAGEYLAAFENVWEKSGRRWDSMVASAFDSAKVVLPADPAKDSPARNRAISLVPPGVRQSSRIERPVFSL
ncbi:MAG: hypothetical protein ACKOLA_00180, partial [Spartobacteria bacterium]